MRTRRLRLYLLAILTPISLLGEFAPRAVTAGPGVNTRLQDGALMTSLKTADVARALRVLFQKKGALVVVDEAEANFMSYAIRGEGASESQAPVKSYVNLLCQPAAAPVRTIVRVAVFNRDGVVVGDERTQMLEEIRAALELVTDD